MSYKPRATTSGVRWREDVGYELRCRDCRTYWPLSDEWWSRRNFSRCKACAQRHKNALDRARYARDPEARARRRQYLAAYRRDARRAKSLYQFERYWSDPDAARKVARDRYYRDRDAILERKRARYADRKAAA